MTLPTAPGNDPSYLYEIALTIGVLGTLVLNLATLVKTFAERKKQDDEVRSKTKIDDADAASVNIRTTLELLPPLKARIKELEAEVASLEAEVRILESEVERLTNEKNILRAKLARIEKANALNKKKLEDADKLKDPGINDEQGAL